MLIIAAHVHLLPAESGMAEPIGPALLSILLDPQLAQESFEGLGFAFVVEDVH
jgi:hypothetical protein